MDSDFELDVKLDGENETVYLKQKEMSMLFDISTDIIGLHIKNILNEVELNHLSITD